MRDEQPSLAVAVVKDDQDLASAAKPMTGLAAKLTLDIDGI